MPSGDDADVPAGDDTDTPAGDDVDVSTSMMMGVSGNDLQLPRPMSLNVPAPAAETGTTVTVTVTDEKKNPVSDAIVDFKPDADASDGVSVPFEPVGDGKYTGNVSGSGTIYVSREGYDETSVEFDSNSYDGANISITLTEITGTCTFNVTGTGTITDEAGDEISTSSGYTFKGASTTVNIEPAAGSYIKSVKRGEDVLAENKEESQPITVYDNEQIDVVFGTLNEWTLTKSGDGGTITDVNDAEVSKQTFIEDTIKIKVKPSEGYYIKSILQQGNDSDGNTETKVNDKDLDTEKTLTISNKDTVSVIFASQNKITLTKTGDGKIYKKGDDTKTELPETVYYIPDTEYTLDFDATTGSFIDYVKVGEASEPAYQNGIAYTGSLTVDDTNDGQTIAIAFKKIWDADTLGAEFLKVNTWLNEVIQSQKIIRNKSYTMARPADSDYTIEWTAADPAVINENQLRVGRYGKDDAITLTVTATLKRGTDKGTEIKKTFSLVPSKLTITEKDCVMVKSAAGWVTEITLHTDGEGNNFTEYQLDNAAKTQITSGNKLDLGEIETNTATLVLYGTENNTSYSASTGQFKIDTKAPVLTDISFYSLNDETGDKSVIKEEAYSTNKPVYVEVTATDGGSGFTKAELYSGDTLALTSSSVANGVASFAEMEGVCEYTFTKLKLYDEAGNVREAEIAKSFSIDTVAPETPAIINGNDNVWIAATSVSYDLTGAEDTKYYVISKDSDTGVDWEQTQAAVLAAIDASGDAPDFSQIADVSVIDASSDWTIAVDAGYALNQAYEIKALDGHRNFSEAALSYTVKIDNILPVYADTGIEFFVDGQKAEDAAIMTNQAVTVSVSGVTDTESGLADTEPVKLYFTVKSGEGTPVSPVVMTPDGNGGYSYTFHEIEETYCNYTGFYIEIQDKVANKATVATEQTVGIDRKGPEISKIEWNGSNDAAYWFTKVKDTFRFDVSAIDNAKLAEVTLYAADTRENAEAMDAADTSLCKKIDVSAENATECTVDFAQWVYNREGAQTYADQEKVYLVCVKDQFGNTTWADSSTQVRIDETQPIIVEKDGKEDISYNFVNVGCDASQTAVLDADLGDDQLVNGKIVSREDVTVSVSVTDPVVNQAASLVKGVSAIIDGSEVALTLAESGRYQHTFTGADAAEKAYSFEKVIVKDNAGNTKTYAYDRTIVVDKKAPTGSFVTDAYQYKPLNSNAISGWYSQKIEGKPLNLTVNGEDANGIANIQWYKTNGTKMNQVADADKLDADPVWNTDEAAVSFGNTKEFIENQNQLYAAKVTDWAGNEVVLCENTAGSTGSLIRIDNEAPDENVYIKWEGDISSNFNTVQNRYDVSGSGFVYNKNSVTLKVYAKDKLLDGLVDGAAGKLSSDIERVEVTPNEDGSNGAVLVADSTQLALIDNEEYLEYSYTIEWKYENREIENYIAGIALYDNAGNRTPATAEVLTDDVKYILDDLAPDLTVDYHSGSYVESALFPDTYFYKQDPGINAVIRERYFFKEDVKVNLSVPEATEVLNQSEWSMGSVEHGSVFSAPGDGRYRFSIEYTDRSQNKMIGENVEGGLFTSKTIVMDTKAPQIDITYEYNGSDVTDEIYDGNFFAGTVTAIVRITEANFDPDQVEIDAIGKASENNGSVGISWDGSWTQESADVWSNKVTFDQQGTYRFTCMCTDIVGQEAERPAQSHFVVDTTNPKVEITYDLNEPLNEKYYKATRTATIRVTDRSFDPEQTEFMMETSGPQPVVGEWVHAAGGGCEGEPTVHVDHCAYECKIVYAEDGDYSLGFQCTDKAGNESEIVLTDPFTVDQTLPEMVVTYDNNDLRNEKYYNARRVGTIQITEHNFNPEEVMVTTTAQNAGAAVNAPVITGWRTEGDVHTTSILYDYDAEFTFNVAYTDLAGNEAAPYGGDLFVVDMTAPVLEITDIEDRSANNDRVAPGITYSDINLDTNGVTMTLIGANNGDTTVETNVTSIPGGLKIQYHDFPRKQEMDDLYTFHAKVEDLAGNVSDQTVLFSVNRFGSVYVFDDATQAILDQYYINEPAHLNVTEINVDTLEFKEITYSKGGDIVTMKSGEDYTVSETGSEGTWKSYTYDISENNFTEESAYTVTIYSEDRATNKSNNIVKEKNIEFVMDITAPTVVVTGVENEEQYNENSRVVTIDATDNIYLAGVTAYLDDKPVKTFDADTLTENGGVVTMEVGSSNEWQTLYIKALDAAGNEYATDARVFLITKNLFVQWYRNVPLFWGSLAGLAALIALLLFFLFYKKKKDEDGNKAA